MPIKATDLKRGNALIWEGQLHVVIGTEHTKPGKGPAYVQAKMKNVATGTIKVNRINSSDKVEDVSIDKRKMRLEKPGMNPCVFVVFVFVRDMTLSTLILRRTELSAASVMHVPAQVSVSP